MHILPIQLDIFLRQPRELRTVKETIYELKKLPYGFQDEGRQWMLFIERWMTKYFCLESIKVIWQMFMCREDDKLVPLPEKVVENFLVPGTSKELAVFLKK